MSFEGQSSPPISHQIKIMTYQFIFQLRVGDLVLLDGDQGKGFFSRLKSQLDTVLTFSPVHYFFFAEAPNDESVNELLVPPAGFDFLANIFGNRSHQKEGASSHRMSYIKHMGVKETLYHHMNADMVIATGSSFPLVAVTVSSKVCGHLDDASSGSSTIFPPYTRSCFFQPVVLFTKSKEGGFYPSQMRADYAMIGDDGTILSPTIAELSAQTLMRFLEVHDKEVPYG